ncbi:endonuclease NucS domain-containing protein [Candidatus Palauibacter sp.]|uniref:endonuclease NucS domain-containing protein n=1 Tax=Candidatus Palauibacter sp. TaxID=3101350 RepID=UPI003B5210F7
MTRLAVWTMDTRNAAGSPQPEPQKAGPSHIQLERHLEDWIVNDATLIGEALTLVGRQVSIDDGRLDLLAIDSQDRWVLIEIKPGMIDSGALGQALYYASSLARLDADDLSRKLEGGLGKFGNVKMLSRRVRELLADEGEEREIALLLVGAGIHPGLERVSEFLGRFGVPIKIVSFEVFELDGGPQLLIREVADEPAKPPRPRHRLTVDAIRARAADLGVGEQFDRFVEISERAGLPVQPQRNSVRIAPPSDRRQFLMYASPGADASGGGLSIWVGPKQFADSFPYIDEEEATAQLGRYDDGGHVAGEKLDKRLDRIECFLQQHLPPQSDD